MNKKEVLAAIEAAGVLAVVRAPSIEAAIATSQALVAGGVYGIEITFTVPNAVSAIQRLAKLNSTLNGRMLLGAGTVTTPAQARAAIDAGAQFLVSPATLPEVIQVAHESNVAMLPGALTPTEILQAHRLGGDIIKIFPAARLGPNYLKDLRSPFPDIPLLPTGGIDATNAHEWLEAGAVALGVGGKLVDQKDIEAGNWAIITQRARELMLAVERVRPKF